MKLLARLVECNILKYERSCSIRSGDLETLTSRCANKPSRNALGRREKDRGRKKGGKRRERGEGTCTRAQRTRLSGQFESIKTEGCCRPLLFDSLATTRERPPFCSLPSTGPRHS